MTSVDRMSAAWQELHQVWTDLGVHTENMALMQLAHTARGGGHYYVLTRVLDHFDPSQAQLPGFVPMTAPTMARMLETALGSAQIIKAARGE